MEVSIFAHIQGDTMQFNQFGNYLVSSLLIDIHMIFRLHHQLLVLLLNLQRELLR